MHMGVRSHELFIIFQNMSDRRKAIPLDKISDVFQEIPSGSEEENSSSDDDDFEVHHNRDFDSFPSEHLPSAAVEPDEDDFMAYFQAVEEFDPAFRGAEEHENQSPQQLFSSKIHSTPSSSRHREAEDAVEQGSQVGTNRRK